MTNYTTKTKEFYPHIDDEAMAEWVQQFEPEDRLIAAIIYEEKPPVVILAQSEYYQQMRTVQTGQTEYLVITKEFGDSFFIESGLSLSDAINFCSSEGFKYTIED